jgi:hypothetical protein
MSETTGIDALLEKRAQYVKNIGDIDAELTSIRTKISKALGDQTPAAPKLGRKPRAAGTTPKATRAPRAARNGQMTVNDAILQSVNKQTGTSIDDIAKSVAKLRGGEVNRKGLGVALSQLKSKGKITNKGLERGFYKLA